MDRVATLTDQIQDWYEHSPKAQRAYARFADDVSAVKTWVTPKAHELWERVAPLIDLSSTPESSDGEAPKRTTGASRS